MQTHVFARVAYVAAVRSPAAASLARLPWLTKPVALAAVHACLNPCTCSSGRCVVARGPRDEALYLSQFISRTAMPLAVHDQKGWLESSPMLRRQSSLPRRWWLGKLATLYCSHRPA